MTDQKQMTLSEFGALQGWNEDQIIQHGMAVFGVDEESVRLMLAIERGQTDGDVVEGE